MLLAPAAALDLAAASTRGAPPQQHTGVISYLELPVVDRDRLDWLVGLMGRYSELQLVYEAHYARHTRRVLQQLQAGGGGGTLSGTPMSAPLTHAAAAAASLEQAWPRDPLLGALRPTSASLAGLAASGRAPPFSALSRATAGELEAAVAALAEVRAGMAAAATAAAVQDSAALAASAAHRASVAAATAAAAAATGVYDDYGPTRPEAAAAAASVRARSTSRMLRTHSQRVNDSVRRASMVSRSPSPARAPQQPHHRHHSHADDDAEAAADRGRSSSSVVRGRALGGGASPRSPGRAFAEAAALGASINAMSAAHTGIGGVGGPRLSPVRRRTHTPGYTRVTPASSHGPLAGR